MNWIKITDKSPDYGKIVFLCAYNDRFPEYSTYDIGELTCTDINGHHFKGNITIDGDITLYDIIPTHWCELTYPEK